MWSRKELKERAKASFKANYWNCVLAGIIIALIAMFIAPMAGNFYNKNNWNSPSAGSTSQLDLENSVVSINGTEYDLENISGADIEAAVNGITQGIENGALNVNGEDIDLGSREDIEEAMDVMEDLQEVASSLRGYSNDDLVGVTAVALAAIAGAMLLFMLIATVLRIFVFNPLMVGCNGFFMANSRYKAGLGEIKRGFSPKWMRNVGSMFLNDLFISLWSLLFVIPGIIKTYSYYMVPFILADDPTIGAKDAITLSRKMMDGHKWNTFVLNLSFIGWLILDVLTLGILGIFYVNPYIYSTDAELYNTLKNNMPQ